MAEIVRLLSAVTHLGKKRGIGLGEVEQWQIESAAEFTLVREGLLLRPLPQAAWGELLPGEEEPDEIPTPVGWTPPQWLPGLWLDGWREGTPVATRWLDPRGSLGIAVELAIQAFHPSRSLSAGRE